jgi:SHS2 domain-containing protein
MAMVKKKKKVEIINHTADVGIIAYGETLEKLFENAAYGMFSLITSVEKIKEKTSVSISVNANNSEELLITFLNELQYYYSVKKKVFDKFEILKLSETQLKVKAFGEKISKHDILHDIKAATYHNLKIKKISNGYKVQIIFDV